MPRFLRTLLLASVAVSFQAAAQTPPGPGTPPAPPPKPGQPTPPPPPGGAPSPDAPVPLPAWFTEIDTAKKGEITREEFVKYRMKTFEQLDTNKDGKISLDEFLKVVEPPFTTESPNLPPLEERRKRARGEFQNLDTNRNGFIERGEAEALVHAEFNQYDTNRDNKVTEAEMRLIVQRSLQREAQREAVERQQAEQRRRQGMMTITEFIDMQLRAADQLDKSHDGKITQQEYLTLAGPADTPQSLSQGIPPYEIRRKVAMIKFQEIDANKDGTLDRVELTAHAVQQFMQIDRNNDRFLNEEEFKKAQEADTQKLRALIQTMMPAAPPRPAPAPAQPRGGPTQPQPQPNPGGLAPGLPQQTR